jgi:hypothetical protein
MSGSLLVAAISVPSIAAVGVSVYAIRHLLRMAHARRRDQLPGERQERP